MTLQEIKQKLNEKFNNKFNSLPLRYILDIDPETSKPLRDENGKEIKAIFNDSHWLRFWQDDERVSVLMPEGVKEQIEDNPSIETLDITIEETASKESGETYHKVIIKAQRRVDFDPFA